MKPAALEQPTFAVQQVSSCRTASFYGSELHVQVPGLSQIGGFKSASVLQSRGRDSLLARVGSQLETVTPQATCRQHFAALDLSILSLMAGIFRPRCSVTDCR